MPAAPAPALLIVGGRHQEDMTSGGPLSSLQPAARGAVGKQRPLRPTPAFGTWFHPLQVCTARRVTFQGCNLTERCGPHTDGTQVRPTTKNVPSHSQMSPGIRMSPAAALSTTTVPELRLPPWHREQGRRGEVWTGLSWEVLQVLSQRYLVCVNSQHS